MKTIVRGGVIVNEGRVVKGAVVIDGDTIVSCGPDADVTDADVTDADVIDATGCYVLPGVIDSHVHFREPGLTEKADMESESRAAAAGGVTTFFDMPNTVPQTTTLVALDEKFCLAAVKSHVNFSFFFGATNDNAALFSQLDPHRIPGIKLFMGSSTGNMLVDSDESLERIFSEAPLPLVAHCEDMAIINRNMEACKACYGDDPEVRLHPLIRSEEACLASTTKAIELAMKYQAQLHLAHLSTRAEVELIPANCLHVITAEATVGHLIFSYVDYERLGARIKVNPAVKSVVDQQELRRGLRDGRISTVATDHAPHLLSQKQGGAARAASGMPMVQFSLPSMLELVDEGVITIERLGEVMAHNPATIFSVRQRGFIRPDFKADLAIVRPDAPWEVKTDVIESLCRWSPLEGHTFRWRVEKTLCNGHLVYDDGRVDVNYFGQPVEFR